MKGNKLKLVTKILAILVICLVSFVGVYKQNYNQMKNQVKGYNFTKDLSGYRELVLEVSDATEVKDENGKVIGNSDKYTDSMIESKSYEKTDVKINPEENLNIENYEKAKSIIETRLKGLGVNDYSISLNTENGTIHLLIPEDDTTNHTISNLTEVSKFEIRDSEDSSQVFLTNDNIKNAFAAYRPTENGTTVYMELKFNKEGTKTLKEISSGEYATQEGKTTGDDSEGKVVAIDGVPTEEGVEIESDDSEGKVVAIDGVPTEENNDEATTSDSEAESNSEAEENNEEENAEDNKQKQIVLAIDDNEMITTSFDSVMKDGVIDLSMNSEGKDDEEISNSLKSSSTIALLLKSGRMPLTYKIAQNEYVNSDISKEIIQKVVYTIIAIIAVALIFLVLKYKFKGILAAIAYIGFVALYLLTIRYTNVPVSIESIVGIVIVFAINYCLIYKLAKVDEKVTEIKSSILKLVPIFIISIIFTFVSWTKISTFGMCIFWGLLLSEAYNYLVSKNILDK